MFYAGMIQNDLFSMIKSNKNKQKQIQDHGLISHNNLSPKIT